MTTKVVKLLESFPEMKVSKSLDQLRHFSLHWFEVILILAIVAAPALNNIIQVRSNQCQVEFKDNFCTSVSNGSGNKT